jgi:methylmalonyl-CoA carboxyltransferase 12S subunit
MARITTQALAEILEKVQGQLAALSERLDRLEAQAPKSAAEAEPVVQEAKQPAPEPPRPEISEEELIAISAALGAYLGVRVRIRQIRLVSSPAWAQQGRVSIQASHNLAHS